MRRNDISKYDEKKIKLLITLKDPNLTDAWSRDPVGMLLSIDSREDGREVRLSRSSFDLLKVSYIALVDGVLLNSLYP